MALDQVSSAHLLRLLDALGEYLPLKKEHTSNGEVTFLLDNLGLSTAHSVPAEGLEASDQTAGLRVALSQQIPLPRQFPHFAIDDESVIEGSLEEASGPQKKDLARPLTIPVAIVAILLQSPEGLPIEVLSTCLEETLSLLEPLTGGL